MKHLLSLERFLNEAIKIDADTYTEPLRDTDEITVYHGFYSLSSALIMAKFGLSGKMWARRVYSYEATNNPKGLFITTELKIAEEFAGSGIAIEFNTKVADLEAPVWSGGRGYFVQGEMTTGFDRDNFDEERNAQMMKNRERAKQDKDPRIANSDRPEVAETLFGMGEKQALYVGDMNPDEISAFWVHSGRTSSARSTVGEWKRLSPQEFLDEFYDEKHLKSNINQNHFNDEYTDHDGMLLRPNDDFDWGKIEDALRTQYGDREGRIDSYKETIGEMMSDDDWETLSTIFYPKQIAQMKKMKAVAGGENPQ